MKHVAGVAIVIAVGFVVLSNSRTASAAQPEAPLSFLQEQLSAGNVKAVDVEHDLLSVELADPRALGGATVKQFRTTLPEGTTSQWTFMEWLLANRRDAAVTVRNQNSLILNILVPLIPWLLIFGFIWFFV